MTNSERGCSSSPGAGIADHYRGRSRRPPLTTLTDETLTMPGADDIAIESLSTNEAIEALVRNLPSDQAEVVLLRVVGDLSVEQVAKIMGRSPGSVRVLQHRALRHLAKIWHGKAVTR